MVIQNKLFNRYASKYLDEIFEKIDNPNVLDVGCSDCSNILLRLEGRNYNHLVGIDYNKDKISEATEKLGDNRHHFIALDLNSDDFISEMISSLWKTDVRGFDLIHISSVLYFFVTIFFLELAILKPFYRMEQVPRWSSD